MRVDHPGGGAGLTCSGACHANAHVSTTVAELYPSRLLDFWYQDALLKRNRPPP